MEDEALIITPDENGDFPAWAVEEALMWKMGHRPDGLFNALRDAMPEQTDIRPLQPDSVITCDWGDIADALNYFSGFHYDAVLEIEARDAKPEGDS